MSSSTDQCFWRSLDLCGVYALFPCMIYLNSSNDRSTDRSTNRVQPEARLYYSPPSSLQGYPRHGLGHSTRACDRVAGVRSGRVWWCQGTHSVSGQCCLGCGGFTRCGWVLCRKRKRVQGYPRHGLGLSTRAYDRVAGVRSGRVWWC